MKHWYFTMLNNPHKTLDTTYNSIKLERFPMLEGIDPFNWLLYRYLNTKTNNYGAILTDAI